MPPQAHGEGLDEHAVHSGRICAIFVVAASLHKLESSAAVTYSTVDRKRKKYISELMVSKDNPDTNLLGSLKVLMKSG